MKNQFTLGRELSSSARGKKTHSFGAPSLARRTNFHARKPFTGEALAETNCLQLQSSPRAAAERRSAAAAAVITYYFKL